MKTHSVADEDGRHIATITPAAAKDVKRLLAKPMTGMDNRSKWCWVRLANGDLLLGTYPQGDTYLSFEHLNL